MKCADRLTIFASHDCHTVIFHTLRAIIRFSEIVNFVGSDVLFVYKGINLIQTGADSTLYPAEFPQPVERLIPSEENGRRKLVGRKTVVGKNLIAGALGRFEQLRV